MSGAIGEGKAVKIGSGLTLFRPVFFLEHKN
jgi:hypothetical protein